MAGNPNSGKSTLFNLLTGIYQKTGNYPGTTVEVKQGSAVWDDGTIVQVTDLPGFYSVFPKGEDENVAVSNILSHLDQPVFDWVVYVADASNIRRSLLLFSQLSDLGLPLVLVLNMADLAQKNGRVINAEKLSEVLGVPVVWMNSRQREGLPELKKILLSKSRVPAFSFYRASDHEDAFAADYKEAVSYRHKLNGAAHSAHSNISLFQSQDAINRFGTIDELLRFCSEERKKKSDGFTQKLDRILTHKVWGYVVFLLVFFLMFQAIFSLAEYPMTWIENGFARVATSLESFLPAGKLSDLLIHGVLAGVGGVVVFVPQIAILFAFLTILEDSGYMARVSFIMDRVMHRFGLNGKSVVPLVGGLACAVASIMAARSIENRKERLLTILVTPLMSCSARLPVYTLLISFITPPKIVLGVFNVQGLLLLLMYLVGVVASISVASLLNYFVRSREKSFFIMELPPYRWPVWRNIKSTIWIKSKTFIWDAGRVIVIIAVLLYLMGTYGPAGKMKEAAQYCETVSANALIDDGEKLSMCNAKKLESSYLGILGSWIEPVIRPLGYDWKIGIALLSSLAAREVFVGTMTTIYSIQDEGNSMGLREKMKAQINPNTGKPVYDIPVALSLMFFYAFALQCASTIVTVRKETASTKIALAHFLFLGILAYLVALAVYQISGIFI